MESKPLKAVAHVLSSLVALLVITWSAHVSAAQAVTIGSVEGHVTVTMPNGEVKRLEAGDTVEAGILNTGNNSSASLTLANGEVINLGSLASYTIGGSNEVGNNGPSFGQRSLSAKSPTLSTATTAGGAIGQDNPSTTPGSGGSPSN